MKPMGRRSRSVPSPRRSARRWLVSGAAVLLVVALAIVYAALTRSGGVPAKAGDVTEFPHIHGMGVDPKETDTLWLGTHGMLVKVIGKTTWSRTGDARYDLMGFNVHPTKPGVLLTSGHPGPGDPRPNPLGVEISQDGGEDWTPLSMAGQADFHAMAVSPKDPSFIYAWNVSPVIGFHRSRDGGRQWTFIPTRAFRQVFALSASPMSREEVWAATDAGLFVSRDGGDNWRPVHGSLLGFPVTAVAIHPARPDRVFAYAAVPQFGLVLSDDAGKTWKPLGWFLGSQDAVGYLAPNPKNPDALYLATFSSDLFWSADGGRTRTLLARGGQVLR